MHMNLHNQRLHRRERQHHRDHDMPGIRRFFRHGRGGRSVRRGNVRFAILSVLGERPMHGYQVIQELESRTQGRWRPSAGSVYPTLQLLEDEGLLTSEEVEARRTYSLTDAGQKAADEHPLSKDGWLETDAAEGGPDLDSLLRSVAQASMQIQRIGSVQARESARGILTGARKGLYRILADDEAEPGS